MFRVSEELIVGVLFTAIIGSPTAIIGWQTYEFLQTGAWTSFSILDLLTMVGINDTWIQNPRSWIGLHQVFAWLHGSVLIVTISSFFLIGILSDNQTRRYE